MVKNGNADSLRELFQYSGQEVIVLGLKWVIETSNPFEILYLKLVDRSGNAQQEGFNDIPLHML